MTRILLAICSIWIYSTGLSQSITQILENIRIDNPCSQIELSVLYKGKAHDYSVLGNSSSVDINQISANNLYEIGSISKVFCGILTQKSIAENKLSLSTNIADVLPDTLSLSEDIASITIKELLTHTSGLSRLPGNLFAVAGFDMTDPYAGYDKTHLYPFLEQYSGKLDKSTATYSNLGAGLLGHILELVCRKDYSKLVKEYIFEPLGMSASTTANLESGKGVFLPLFTEDCKETNSWSFDILGPAGSIKSSLTDMKIFAKACLSSEQFPHILASFTKLNKINDKRSNGSFWIIGKLNGHMMYGHSGRTGGSASSLIIVPEIQLAAIALNNSSSNIESYLFDIIKEIIK